MAIPKARQRREQTKIRLQEAMLEQLGNSSFRELRIGDIAEAAGVSRSGFYFYYPDKTALLMDATADVSHEIFEQADRWWHGEGEPAELIDYALSAAADLWARNGALLPTAVEVSTYDAEVREAWRTLVGHFVTATAEHIASEQRAGVVDDELDPQGTAEMLIWGVERNLYRLATTVGREPKELVEPTTEIWLRAIYRRTGSG